MYLFSMQNHIISSNGGFALTERLLFGSKDTQLWVCKIGILYVKH